MTAVVQIDGKVRATLEVPARIDAPELEQLARADERVAAGARRPRDHPRGRASAQGRELQHALSLLPRRRARAPRPPMPPAERPLPAGARLASGVCPRPNNARERRGPRAVWASARRSWSCSLALAVTVAIGILRGASAPVETVAVDDADGAGCRRPRHPSTCTSRARWPRPGLYVLDAAARVVDADRRRGRLRGRTPIESAVNLARPVSDGEQLHVPLRGRGRRTRPRRRAGDGRVNLNTADAAELDTLPRIGAGDGASASSSGATRTAASRASRTCSPCPGSATRCSRRSAIS